MLHMQIWNMDRSIPVSLVVGAGNAFVAGQAAAALAVHAAVPRLVRDAEDVVLVLSALLVVVLETVWVGLVGYWLVFGRGGQQSLVDLYVWLRVGVDYGWLRGKRIGLVIWHVGGWIIDRAIEVILRKIPRRVADDLRGCYCKLNHIGLFPHQRVALPILPLRRKGVRVRAVLIDLWPLRLVAHVNKSAG